MACGSAQCSGAAPSRGAAQAHLATLSSALALCLLSCAPAVLGAETRRYSANLTRSGGGAAGAASVSAVATVTMASKLYDLDASAGTSLWTMDLQVRVFSAYIISEAGSLPLVALQLDPRRTTVALFSGQQQQQQRNSLFSAGATHWRPHVPGPNIPVDLAALLQKREGIFDRSRLGEYTFSRKTWGVVGQENAWRVVLDPGWGPENVHSAQSWSPA